MNEIIEKLKMGLMVCIATDTTLVHVEREDAEKIIALLKEQEAIKPTKNEDGELFCGNCGENVGIETDSPNLPYVHYKYCSFCGRKVKWDG